MATYDDEEEDLDFEDLQEISLFSPRSVTPGLHDIGSARVVLERLPTQQTLTQHEANRERSPQKTSESARVVLERLPMQQALTQKEMNKEKSPQKISDSARVVLDRLPTQQTITQNDQPDRTNLTISPKKVADSARVVLDRLPIQQINERADHQTTKVRSPQKISDSAQVVLDRLPTQKVIVANVNQAKTANTRGKKQISDSSPGRSRHNNSPAKTKEGRSSKKITDSFSPSRRTARQNDNQEEKAKEATGSQKMSDSLKSPSNTNKKNDPKQKTKEARSPQKTSEPSSSPHKTNKQNDQQKKTTEVRAPQLITEYFSLSLSETTRPKPNQQKTKEAIQCHKTSEFTKIKRNNKRPRTFCTVPLLNLNVITRKDGRVECRRCKFVSKSIAKIEQHVKQCAGKQTQQRSLVNDGIFANTPRVYPGPSTSTPSWLGFCHDPSSTTDSSALSHDVPIPLDVDIKEETNDLGTLAIQASVPRSSVSSGESTAGVQFIIPASGNNATQGVQHVAFAFQAACTQCGKKFMSAAEHKEHVATCWGKDEAGSPNKGDKRSQRKANSSPWPQGGRKGTRKQAQYKHKCTLCQEKFQTESDMRSHITENHMEIDIGEPIVEEIPAAILYDTHDQPRQTRSTIGTNLHPGQTTQDLESGERQTATTNLKRKLKDKIQSKKVTVGSPKHSSLKQKQRIVDRMAERLAESEALLASESLQQSKTRSPTNRTRQGSKQTKLARWDKVIEETSKAVRDTRVVLDRLPLEQLNTQVVPDDRDLLKEAYSTPQADDKELLKKAYEMSQVDDRELLKATYKSDRESNKDRKGGKVKQSSKRNINDISIEADEESDGEVGDADYGGNSDYDGNADFDDFESDEIYNASDNDDDDDSDFEIGSKRRLKHKSGSKKSRQKKSSGDSAEDEMGTNFVEKTSGSSKLRGAEAGRPRKRFTTQCGIGSCRKIFGNVKILEKHMKTAHPSTEQDGQRKEDNHGSRQGDKISRRRGIPINSTTTDSLKKKLAAKGNTSSYPTKKQLLGKPATPNKASNLKGHSDVDTNTLLNELTETEKETIDDEYTIEKVEDHDDDDDDDDVEIDVENVDDEGKEEDDREDEDEEETGRVYKTGGTKRKRSNNTGIEQDEDKDGNNNDEDIEGEKEEGTGRVYRTRGSKRKRSNISYNEQDEETNEFIDVENDDDRDEDFVNEDDDVDDKSDNDFDDDDDDYDDDDDDSDYDPISCDNKFKIKRRPIPAPASGSRQTLNDKIAALQQPLLTPDSIFHDLAYFKILDRIYKRRAAAAAAAEATTSSAEPADKDQTLTTDQTLSKGQTSTLNETQGEDKTPAIDKTIASDQTPAAKQTPATDKPLAINQVLVTDQTPKTIETSEIEQTPSTDKTSTNDQTPATDEAMAAKQTSAPSVTDAEKTTVVQPGPNSTTANASVTVDPKSDLPTKELVYQQPGYGKVLKQAIRAVRAAKKQNKDPLTVTIDDMHSGESGSDTDSDASIKLVILKSGKRKKGEVRRIRYRSQKDHHRCPHSGCGKMFGSTQFLEKHIASAHPSPDKETSANEDGQNSPEEEGPSSNKENRNETTTSQPINEETDTCTSDNEPVTEDNEQPTKSFKCCFGNCETEFTSKKEFQLHLKEELHIQNEKLRDGEDLPHKVGVSEILEHLMALQVYNMDICSCNFPDCEQIFFDLAETRYHVSKTHYNAANQVYMYICDRSDCYRAFATKNDLRSHEIVDHAQAEVKSLTPMLQKAVAMVKKKQDEAKNTEDGVNGNVEDNDSDVTEVCEVEGVAQIGEIDGDSKKKNKVRGKKGRTAKSKTTKRTNQRKTTKGKTFHLSVEGDDIVVETNANDKNKNKRKREELSEESSDEETEDNIEYDDHVSDNNTATSDDSDNEDCRSNSGANADMNQNGTTQNDEGNDQDAHPEDDDKSDGSDKGSKKGRQPNEQEKDKTTDRLKTRRSPRSSKADENQDSESASTEEIKKTEQLISLERSGGTTGGRKTRRSPRSKKTTTSKYGINEKNSAEKNLVEIGKKHGEVYDSYDQLIDNDAIETLLRGNEYSEKVDYMPLIMDCENIDDFTEEQKSMVVDSLQAELLKELEEAEKTHELSKESQKKIGKVCRHVDCGESFATNQKFIEHFKEKHRTPRCYHQGCGKKFDTKEQLKNHVQNQHLNLKIYRCEKCKDAFRSLDFLRLHTLKEHGMPLPDSVVPDYRCLNCNLIFLTKKLATEHYNACRKRSFILSMLNKQQMERDPQVNSSCGEPQLAFTGMSLSHSSVGDVSTIAHQIQSNPTQTEKEVSEDAAVTACQVELNLKQTEKDVARNTENTACQDESNPTQTEKDVARNTEATACQDESNPTQTEKYVARNTETTVCQGEPNPTQTDKVVPRNAETTECQDEPNPTQIEKDEAQNAETIVCQGDSNPKPTEGNETVDNPCSSVTSSQEDFPFTLMKFSPLKQNSDSPLTKKNDSPMSEKSESPLNKKSDSPLTQQSGVCENASEKKLSDPQDLGNNEKTEPSLSKFHCQKNNCGESFDSKMDLIEHDQRCHMELEYSKLPLQCAEKGCSKRFLWKKDLLEHKDHCKHGNQKISWSVSQMIADNNSAAGGNVSGDKEMSRTGGGENKFEPKKTIQSEDIMFWCTVCMCSCPSKQALEWHNISQHCRFGCGHNRCARTFKTRAELLKHITSHGRPGDQASAKPKPALASDIESGRKNKHLTSHNRPGHSDNGPEPLPTLASDIDTGRKIASPHKFRCKTCPHVAENAQELQNHEKTEHKLVGFWCRNEECDSFFSTRKEFVQHELQNHMDIDQSLLPVACKKVGCQKRFLYKRDMIRHMLTCGLQDSDSKRKPQQQGGTPKKRGRKN